MKIICFEEEITKSESESGRKKEMIEKGSNPASSYTLYRNFIRKMNQWYGTGRDNIN